MRWGSSISSGRVRCHGGDLLLSRAIPRRVSTPARSWRAADRGAAGQVPPGDRRRRPVSYPHPWLSRSTGRCRRCRWAWADHGDLPGAVLKYLAGRGLAAGADRKVWAFLGDGETDEPESLGAIALASREKLDTSSSSSTATCSGWTARSAATARSSRSWRASSRAGWNVIR